MEKYNRSPPNTYTKIVAVTNIKNNIKRTVKRIVFEDFEMIRGKRSSGRWIQIEDRLTSWCIVTLELKDDLLAVEFYRRPFWGPASTPIWIKQCFEVVRIYITIFDELENKQFLTQLKQSKFNRFICSGVIATKDRILEHVPNILINKLLILEFTIETINISINYADVYQINHSRELNRTNLFDDYFNNKNFSDVLLKVNEKSLPAHRIILSAHSDYFKGMFNCNNMIESQTSEVKLQDIDFNVLHSLVYFMYTGEIIIDHNRYLPDLLIAADYYIVEKLKKYCVFHILCQININNICDLMVFAEYLNADTLKLAIRFFFKFYKCDIFISDNWKSLNTAYPEICLAYFNDSVCIKIT